MYVLVWLAVAVTALATAIPGPYDLIGIDRSANVDYESEESESVEDRIFWREMGDAVFEVIKNRTEAVEVTPEAVILVSRSALDGLKPPNKKKWESIVKELGALFQADNPNVTKPNVGSPSKIENHEVFWKDIYDNEAYTRPNQRSGQRLKAWLEAGGKGNPEEQGTYYEGDILLDVRQANFSESSRNGILDERFKWTTKVVPYEIRGTFPAEGKKMITDAIDKIQSKTCIKFQPRGYQRDYISIQNYNAGCFSNVGKTGGKQVVNLQFPGCFTKTGTAIHELLHALGLFHEQTRADRDKHVRINFENIVPESIGNFVRQSTSLSYGVKYNVASILHYSPFAGSKNGKKTIEALKNSPLNGKMGQRDELTDEDVEKVNAMYCQKSA